MMNKMFNLTSTFKSEPQEDGSVMVRGMASTADFDRAGDSIISDAWTKGGLGNFEKNPIILFNHDHNKPIGRATKVTPTNDGLHMEAKISKHAECADLIKDGVLGAFSVGFKVKDADYVKETDGLQIKDAELFEVSVVSIPCNQAATFSLAKSFDSEMEYEDFKKTFKSEEDSSSKEIDMSEATQTPEIDLEAFAKKVAEETAAKISMKQAEQKAAEKAEAEKAAEAEAAKEAQALEVQSKIKTGIETGAEKLVADLQKEFEAKNAETAEIIEKYKKDLDEKAEELQAMQNSKKTFSDRSGTGRVEDIGSELVDAKILGSLTRKGWETDYAKDLFARKNVGVVASTGNTITLDTIVSTQFEQEVQLELKTAGLFREIPVTSNKTVLPLQPESVAATFNAGAPASSDANTAANLRGVLNGSNQSSGVFNAAQTILTTGRLTSTTYLTLDTEESTLVSLLPMIREASARAHARAIDKMVISGNAGGAGTVGNEGVIDASGTAIAVTGTNDTLAGADILAARAAMKKYGLNPADLAIAVSFTAYNDLLSDINFQDVTEVGSDLAIKVTGQLGTIFAIPVIVTDEAGLSDDRTGNNVCAVVFNYKNFVIPRLKGVTIETEYQVGNQRNAIVASQSLGFEKLFAGAAGVGLPSQVLRFTA